MPPIQVTRNNHTRLIDIGDRGGGRLNAIRFGVNESRAHFDKKCDIVYKLREAGHHIYCEVHFTDHESIADILDLDTGTIIEILVTETDEQFKEKIKKFPSVFKIDKVRVAEGESERESDKPKILNCDYYGIKTIRGADEMVTLDIPALVLKFKSDEDMRRFGDWMTKEKD